MAVRHARASDIGAIVALEALFPTDRMSRRGLRRLLRSPSAHVFVYAVPGGLGGAAVLLTRRNAGVARLYSIVVDRRRRGRGIGRALLRRAERAARDRGCRELRLEVRPGARAARRLYAQAGYVEVGRRSTYYGDGADARRLSKTLKVNSRA